MKIVTYNIQFGQGRDGHVDLDRIVAAVDGADLIALQEVDRFWSRSGNTDQVAALSQAFAGYDYSYGPGVDQSIPGLKDDDGRPLRRQFGNLLLSRQPIRYCRHHLLPKSASTGPLSIQRSALECAVQYGELVIRFFSLHLTHLSSETRRSQVRKLLNVHREAAHEGLPVCGDAAVGYWSEGVMVGEVPPHAVLLGDFNCEPDAPEYELLVGPDSPYGGRVTHPLGFVDAWVYAGGGLLDGHTSDVDGKPARLDYCFVSASLRDTIGACHVDDTADGSDHQPVWLELSS